MFYYNHPNVANARKLRSSMTPWERKLWYCFLKTYPKRFQRQKCIGNYIADFYCHQASLIVELDGSQHYTPEEMEYDRIRTEYLESLGLQVLRFSNLDITRNFENICEMIDMTAKERTSQK